MSWRRTERTTIFKTSHTHKYVSYVCLVTPRSTLIHNDMKKKMKDERMALGEEATSALWVSKVGISIVKFACPKREWASLATDLGKIHRTKARVTTVPVDH